MSVQFLVAGQADIAWPSPAGTINAYVAGHDVVGYFAIGYEFPFEVVAPEDSPVTAWDAEQLRGTTIGVTEFAGGEVPMLLGGLHMLGLEDGVDFELKEIGAGGPLTFAELDSGKCQVYAGSVIDTGNLENAGMKLRNINPPGVRDFPANTFLTTRQYFDDNYDLCVGVARAVAKAEYWMKENVIGAIDIAAKFAPEEVEGTGIEGMEVMLLEYSVGGVEAKPEGILYGFQPLEPWWDYQEYLLASGSPDPSDPITFTEPIDPSLILDNSVPADVWADFDMDAVIEDAQNYQLEVITKPPFNYQP
jgi:NitT/TauT family transport system substrate-binding protein